MGYPDARLYDTRGSATETEIEYLRALGTHLVGTERANHRMGSAGNRLHLLMNYLESLDRKGFGRRDTGKADRQTIREVCMGMIAEETKEKSKFIPRNGHGLYGSREYARQVNRRRASE